MHSHSSRVFSLSDNKANDSNTKSATDHGSVHGNDSGPEEITLEEELCMYLNFYLASNVLWFNLMRVEIRELRPEVIAEDEGVLVHYRSRTNA